MRENANKDLVDSTFVVLWPFSLVHVRMIRLFA